MYKIPIKMINVGIIMFTWRNNLYYVFLSDKIDTQSVSPGLFQSITFDLLNIF